MQFDPNNKVVQLCAKGMEVEARSSDEALSLFQQAWEITISDFEKFIAAHYVARHQSTIMDKLRWDEKALTFALEINDDHIRAYYPSLYLNLAKSYEDLNDFSTAQKNYQLASWYIRYLPDDGYGRMIEAGIQKGIERISK